MIRRSGKIFPFRKNFGRTSLYLEVVFRAPWGEYFEINVNDPTDYSVSDEPFDAEGLEKALLDYCYVIEEFDNKFWKKQNHSVF